VSLLGANSNIVEVGLKCPLSLNFEHKEVINGLIMLKFDTLVD